MCHIFGKKLEEDKLICDKVWFYFKNVTFLIKIEILQLESSNMTLITMAGMETYLEDDYECLDTCQVEAWIMTHPVLISIWLLHLLNLKIKFSP